MLILVSFLLFSYIEMSIATEKKSLKIAICNTISYTDDINNLKNNNNVHV